MSFPVTVRAGGREIRAEARPGQTVRALLQEIGLPVDAPCGGRGTCGKCLCEVRGDASAVGRVRACQTTLRGPAEIVLPDRGPMRTETEDSDKLPADREVPEGAAGLAFDIGTTTLAAALYDMRTGARLGSAGAENPQRAFGADVMSRIEACMRGPDALPRQRDGVRAALRALAEELLGRAGIAPDRVCRAAVCGNTVMMHLFAGMSPVSMGAAPYTPLSRFGYEEDARVLGLPFGGPAELLPAPGPFVGADCAAALLACGMDLPGPPALLADVGTNGELALRTENGLWCTSAAAGPAFEGAGISCGMCALPGAVTAFSFEGASARLETAEGAPPAGLCGSGLLSLLAALLRAGLVDEGGRLLPPEEAPAEYRRLLDGSAQGVRFFVAPGVWLTDGDVRALQLAKAAVCAGIRVLLARAGLAPGRVAGFALAGGFGASLDADAAAAAGLFPAELRPVCRPAGNAAARGCAMALLSSRASERLRALVPRAQVVDLAADPAFAARFMEEMAFSSQAEQTGL